MIRTIVSIFVTLGVILGLSITELYQVQKTFSTFEKSLEALYEKTEQEIATHEDGKAVLRFWEKKKNSMYVWLPHTALQEFDYQLNEMLGYLYVEDYQSTIPKIEMLIAMAINIPQSYSIGFENVF